MTWCPDMVWNDPVHYLVPNRGFLLLRLVWRINLLVPFVQVLPCFWVPYA